MKTEVVVPKWGMGLDEGTIVKWLSSVGERVEQGQAIVEVETAKATQEVEAPVGGTLVEILVDEDTTVPVNTVIALIES